mgnify:CR=1 FL=1
MLENWNVGMLENWNVGKLEITDCPMPFALCNNEQHLP